LEGSPGWFAGPPGLLGTGVPDRRMANVRNAGLWGGPPGSEPAFLTGAWARWGTPV